jgi:hypothetical protein
MIHVGSSVIGSITSGLETQKPWLHLILLVGVLGLASAFVTVAISNRRAGYYAGMLSFFFSLSVSVIAIVGTTSMRHRKDIDHGLLGRIAVPIAFIACLVGIAGTVRRLYPGKRKRPHSNPVPSREIEPQRSRVIGIVGGVTSTAFMLGAAIPLFGQGSSGTTRAREAVELLKAGSITEGCAILTEACELGATADDVRGFQSAVSQCFEMELIRAMESPEGRATLERVGKSALPLSTEERARLTRETERLAREGR